MDEKIRDIILEIKKDCIFDAHTVIFKLLEKFPDEYLQFGKNHSQLSTMHSRIAESIDSFDGDLIKRQDRKSYSKNLCNNYSECTCWRKL